MTRTTRPSFQLHALSAFALYLTIFITRSGLVFSQSPYERIDLLPFTPLSQADSCDYPTTSSDTIMLCAPASKCFPAPQSGMPEHAETYLVRTRFSDGSIKEQLAPLPRHNHHLPLIHIAAETQSLFGWYGLLQQHRSGKAMHSVFAVDQQGNETFFFRAMLAVHAPSQDPQRSLRLEAQREEGQSNFPGQYFPNMPNFKLHSLVLRNGGADGLNLGGSGFRDLLAAQLYARLDSKYHYAPGSTCHIYLNGRYYGISNLRLRFDQRYFRQFDAIAIIERDADLASSYDYYNTDSAAWQAMIHLAHDVEQGHSPTHRLLSRINRNEFYDYHILEIFSGNRDWLTNNLLFFCDSDSIWHPVLWDLDWGFGLFGENETISSPQWNSLQFALSPTSGWGEHEPSNEIFRTLMSDRTEQSYFASRMAAQLNTALSAEQTVKICDSIAMTVAPELSMHFNQWGGTMERWQESVGGMRSYLMHRNQNCLAHLSQTFGDSSLVKINLGECSGGSVMLGGVPVSGVLMVPGGIPLSISARADSCHLFYCWSDDLKEKSRVIKRIDDQKIWAPIFIHKDSFPSHKESKRITAFNRRELRKLKVIHWWDEGGQIRSQERQSMADLCSKGAIAALVAQGDDTFIVLL